MGSMLKINYFINQKPKRLGEVRGGQKVDGGGGEEGEGERQRELAGTSLNVIHVLRLNFSGNNFPIKTLLVSVHFCTHRRSPGGGGGTGGGQSSGDDRQLQGLSQRLNEARDSSGAAH